MGDAAFWRGRVFRLYPIYLAVLVANLVVRYAAGGLRGYPRLSPGTTAFVVAAHLTMLGQDALTFLGLDRATGSLHATRFALLEPDPAYRLSLIAPAWSLSVEILFYAVAPFLLRRGWRALAALALASFALREAGDRLLGLRVDPWTYRFFPFEIGTFLMGALAYHAYRALGTRGASVALPLLVLYASAWGALLAAAIVPLSGTVPVVVALGLPFLFARTRDSRLDRAIGDLSYPLYLVHVLVLDVLGRFHVRGGLPVAAASLVVAAALVRLIDVPVDRFRQRLARRSGASPLSDFGIAGESLAAPDGDPSPQ